MPRKDSGYHPRVQCALHQQQIIIKTVKSEKEMVFIMDIK